MTQHITIKNIIKGAMVTALFAILLQPVTEAFELTMKDVYMTRGDVIALNEIAMLTHDDISERMANDILSIVVCRSPRVGFKREINREHIVMKLKQQSIDVAQLKFSGAPFITITREEQAVSPELQEEAFIAWVEESLALPREAFSVDFQKQFRRLVVPMGEVEFVFNKDLRSVVTRRHVGVPCEVYVNGEFFSRNGINFSLKLLRTVVVARRGIARTKHIRAADVMVTQRFVSTNVDDYCMSLDEAVGMLAKKEIKQDMPLRHMHLEQRICVRRGERINCTIADKNMTVMVKLQIQQNGKKGDVVRLLNPSTNRTVNGRVITDGVVELLL